MASVKAAVKVANIPKTYKSAGGRTYTIGKLEHTPPRFEGDPLWSDTFRIYLDGEEVGWIARNMNFSREGEPPRWQGGLTKLVWKVKRPDPFSGLGHDVAAFDDVEGVLKAWTASADGLLDWRAKGSPPSARQAAQVMRSAKPEFRTIAEDTPIVPGMVARIVVEEADALSGGLLGEGGYLRSLEGRLVIRADTVYASNETWRKTIRSSKSRGRDALYAFMRHWAAAQIAEEKPQIRAAMNDQDFRRFAVGVPVSPEPSEVIRARMPKAASKPARPKATVKGLVAEYMTSVTRYAGLTPADAAILRPIVEEVVSGKVTKRELIDRQREGKLGPRFKDLRPLKPGEAGTSVMSPLGLAIENLYNNFRWLTQDVAPSAAESRGAVEKPARKAVEKPSPKAVEKPSPKTVEKPSRKAVEKTVSKAPAMTLEEVNRILRQKRRKKR